MNGKTEAQRCFSHFLKAMQLVSGWAGIPQKRAGHHHPSILKAPWHLLLLFGYAGQGGCRRGCSPAERGWRDSSSWTSRAPRAGLPLTLSSMCSPHLMVWGGNALIKSKDFEGSPWWFSGYDTVLPLQGAWVQSLVGELKSHKTHATAKKQTKHLGT